MVLSRELAEAGHYPAIDIEASISRVMVDVVAPEHDQVARRFKQIYSTYRQNKDLINVGAYQAGSDPQIDEAIVMYPRLINFLQQHMHEQVTWNNSLAGLVAALGGTVAEPDQA